MTEALSEYELARLETIRKNQLAFESMGLGDAVAGLRAAASRPKLPKARSKRPAADPSARRSSRRLSGEAAANGGLVDSDGEKDHPAYRDPNDVSAMTAPELKAWCDALRADVLRMAWVERLGEEEMRRLDGAQEWLAPFVIFTARFGGKGESSLSRQNLKSVLKQVFCLVSGAGVTTEKRGGAFGKGRPIGLGIQAEQVDALRAEAQVWMPQKRAPEDLVGRTVGGERIVKQPDRGPFDTSNGWLLNHPLMKIRLYCEHLDELKEMGHEATMRRLTGDGAWEPASIADVNEDGTYDVALAAGAADAGKMFSEVEAAQIRLRA
ncbi:hypothetical protein EMIHUDRAFT_449486 [Emiliania huxleyi CCMP1516]|uniref:Uncharacterized protein n=2 Tax=Emiliania huxleyi TaxID=2903 RepID=A0A0D3K8F7_EMIH1|nr:hypothetical protein EMIHUDRAFT_449486 [Emiliania huxleyi CCMP1516]EOD32042.1 hypothetical protein EMIHUDRAFT_449486 [Emiliania huxleyi CCMP1516]|eukprot:XP_005784471.1 hypothetical protein EMIHUDRAFT_449486 [Emiliania huxleyi CCMP1516]